jgi:hypothetical protein
VLVGGDVLVGVDVLARVGVVVGVGVLVRVGVVVGVEVAAGTDALFGYGVWVGRLFAAEVAVADGTVAATGVLVLVATGWSCWLVLAYQSRWPRA